MSLAAECKCHTAYHSTPSHIEILRYRIILAHQKIFIPIIIHTQLLFKNVGALIIDSGILIPLKGC